MDKIPKIKRSRKMDLNHRILYPKEEYSQIFTIQSDGSVKVKSVVCGQSYEVDFLIKVKNDDGGMCNFCEKDKFTWTIGFASLCNTCHQDYLKRLEKLNL